MDMTADKSKQVREAAEDAAKAIIDGVSQFAIDLLVPVFLQGIGVKAKPAQKESTLNVIAHTA